ncbi:MAG: ABC transporter ATP-binding protein [Blautia caecimuris]
MAIVECRNLKKEYNMNGNKIYALNNIDFFVEKGEFVSIVGSSGSGKSTLLHMIGGVDNPTSGSIIVNNKEIGKMTEKELALYRRRNVGIIYQFFNLIPTLNVEKNIKLPLLLDNGKIDKKYYSDIIDILSLKDRETYFPHQLSGGQQQRVAIGRALMYKPSILLADEPTGNLDKKNTKEIVQLLKTSNKQFNQTIILITHDLKIAEEANRIVTIEDGKIIRDERRI